MVGWDIKKIRILLEKKYFLNILKLQINWYRQNFKRDKYYEMVGRVFNKLFSKSLIKHLFINYFERYFITYHKSKYYKYLYHQINQVNYKLANKNF